MPITYLNNIKHPIPTWQMYLFIGIACAIAQPITQFLGATAVSLSVVAIIICTFFASLLGLSRTQHHYRFPWIIFVLAHGFFMCGTLMQWLLSPQFSPLQPASIADYFFISAYLLQAIMLLLLIGIHQHKMNAFLDGLMVSLCLMAIAWQFWISPWIDQFKGVTTFWHQMLRFSYPILSSILLSLLVVLQTQIKKHNAALSLFIVGSLFWLLGSVVCYMTQTKLYMLHAAQLVFWLLAHVFWGAFLLHPSVHFLDGRIVQTEPDLDQWQVWLMIFTSLGLPLISWGLQTYDKPITRTFTLSSLAILGLISVRLYQLYLGIRKHHQQLDSLANTDFLTGIANRRYFERRVKMALRQNQPLAVMLLDLDRFKNINETFGHLCGDQLLTEIASRWQHTTENKAILARLGGDEFGVLATDFTSKKDIVTMAWSLHHALATPIETTGIRLNAVTSIGIVYAPEQGQDYSTVLRRASSALRAAKRMQSQVEEYDSSLNIEESRLALLINEIRFALKHHELRVYFQPKLALATYQVVGFEALVRWQHASEGLIMPSTFMPALEQTDIFRELTFEVLNQTFSAAATLREQGNAYCISVNISTRSLVDPSFTQDLQRLLQTYQLQPEWIELEITETSALNDRVRSVETLNKIRKMGFHLSIDDYGTGYSSLARLKEISASILKLDKLFIQSMSSEPQSFAIVKSTLELAKTLHMQVVAEGVEDENTFALLEQLECYAVQGFFVSKPIPFSDIESTLATLNQKFKRPPTFVLHK